MKKQSIVNRASDVLGIVKRVSWFKSSFFTEDSNQIHKHILILKTKDSILIEKYAQQMRRRNQAWRGLGLSVTGSILITEKLKHLSKMSDRVSRNVLERKRSRVGSREYFIEVYIDNRSLFVIVYSLT
jgi:hypothetical protein